jgi:hypothetical protein
MSGKQFLRLWEGVLDSLATDAADETIGVLLLRISRMPEQPKAIKRLVLDMQVGQHMHTSAELTHAHTGLLPTCKCCPPCIRVTVLTSCRPCCYRPQLLLQLPRKLGELARSRLKPDPFAHGSRWVSGITETLGILLHMTGDASAQLKLAIVQQINDTGLFRSLDVLAEATAVQLEQLNAALQAAGGSGGRSAADVQGLALEQCGFKMLDLDRLQGTAGRLLALQVRLSLGSVQPCSLLL